MVDNQYITATVGLNVAEAMQSFWLGDYDRCTHLLLQSQPKWHLLGGSHAQRDVFAQTLIHSAMYSGHVELARSLLSERYDRHMSNPCAIVLNTLYSLLQGNR
jgi:hypothetical protein